MFGTVVHKIMFRSSDFSNSLIFPSCIAKAFGLGSTSSSLACCSVRCSSSSRSFSSCPTLEKTSRLSSAPWGSQSSALHLSISSSVLRMACTLARITFRMKREKCLLASLMESLIIKSVSLWHNSLPQMDTFKLSLERKEELFVHPGKSFLQTSNRLVVV